MSEVAELYIKANKIPKLLPILIRGAKLLSLQFCICAFSILYNITWLTRIIIALIIIIIIIMPIYIYKELRKQYLEGKYLRVGKSQNKKKRTSPPNDWSPLRPKYIKIRS